MLNPTRIAAILCSVLAAGSAQAFVEDDVYRAGNIYQRSESWSAHHCRKACTDDDACMSWTFIRQGVRGPRGFCELKSDVGAAEENPCCQSGLSAQLEAQKFNLPYKPLPKASMKPATSLAQRPVVPAAMTENRIPSAAVVRSGANVATSVPLLRTTQPDLAGPPPASQATPPARDMTTSHQPVIAARPSITTTPPQRAVPPSVSSQVARPEETPQPPRDASEPALPQAWQHPADAAPALAPGRQPTAPQSDTGLRARSYSVAREYEAAPLRRGE